eukprot:gene33303-37632_t
MSSGSTLLHQDRQDQQVRFANLLVRNETSGLSRTSHRMELMAKTRFTEIYYQCNRAYHEFIVPAGLTTTVTTKLYGARGGGVPENLPSVITSASNGNGNAMIGYMTVTAGQKYYLFVGSMGTDTSGGYNGGGDPVGVGYTGGGGASDIRSSLTSIVHPYKFVAAAGGGGNYAACGSNGGNGHYPSGQDAGPASKVIPCAAESAPGDGAYGNIGGSDALGCSGTAAAVTGSGGTGCSSGGAGGGGGYYGGGGGYRAGGGGGIGTTQPPFYATNYASFNSGGGYIILSFTRSYPDDAIFYEYNAAVVAHNYTVPALQYTLWVELHGAWGNCKLAASGGMGGRIA